MEIGAIVRSKTAFLLQKCKAERPPKPAAKAPSSAQKYRADMQVATNVVFIDKISPLVR